MEGIYPASINIFKCYLTSYSLELHNKMLSL
nr:MAG TPA: hypothetical protein [Microviridae sp.]